ncbi:hypothetical protein KFY46_25405, partial [Salmonella enterica subsp. enterica serovar 1,4,[5],12:i:-]|nr:hypothetical protein [Salmonella enterica subsp. enterica serovar 1,4,[5],12:i:-]
CFRNIWRSFVLLLQNIWRLSLVYFINQRRFEQNFYCLITHRRNLTRHYLGGKQWLLMGMRDRRSRLLANTYTSTETEEFGL